MTLRPVPPRRTPSQSSERARDSYNVGLDMCFRRGVSGFANGPVGFVGLGNMGEKCNLALLRLSGIQMLCSVMLLDEVDFTSFNLPAPVATG